MSSVFQQLIDEHQARPNKRTLRRILCILDNEETVIVGFVQSTGEGHHEDEIVEITELGNDEEPWRIRWSDVLECPPY